MQSEAKKYSELIRNKIHLKSINQLLQNRITVQVPEQKLKIKFDSLKPSTLLKQNQNNKKIIKLHHRSRSNVLQDTSSNLSIFKNNKIYQKINYGTLADFRSKWSPQKSAQFVKRSTMPQFKFKSLQIQNYEHNAGNNKMWKPIHYIKSPQSLQKQQSQQNLQQRQKNRIKLKLGRQKSHQYLKKGTDINKRVVVNLLKIKLAHKSHKKSISNIQQQADNTIRNNEILKMIRIYKGYGQSSDLNIQQKNRRFSELKLYQSKQQQREKEYKNNMQFKLNKQLDIKAFPFHNINIQLSVSKWNQQKQKNYRSGSSDIEQHL